jgi:hypothetical protein
LEKADVRAKGDVELLSEQVLWIQQLFEKANERRRVRMGLE